MKPLFFLLLINSFPLTAAERIVSVGGGLTEIIYALGLEAQLVGTDTSSVYPEPATKLPQVGYARALSAEGLLSLNPTLLICHEEAGPPAVLDQIEKAGVRVLKLRSEPSAENVEQRITAIANTLGEPAKAEVLIQKIRSELVEAKNHLTTNKPRTLFIYARSGGILNVSGTGTSADAMIRLAGGVNAISGYEGYKPLTAEAALLAAPEVILVTSRGLEDAGGVDGLLKHPGLAQTPAAQNRRVIAMDDLLLLGFGPRLGQAVGDLARLIRGDKSLTTTTVLQAR